MSKNPDNPELPLFDNSSDPQEPGELSLQYLQEQVEASNGEFFQGVAIGVSLNYPDFILEGVYSSHFTVKGFDEYWVAIMRLVRQNKDVTVKAIIKELSSTVDLEHYKELSKLKDFGAKDEVHPDRIGELMDFHQCSFSSFMRVKTTKPQSIKLDPDDGADEPRHDCNGAVLWKTAADMADDVEPIEWVIPGWVPRSCVSLLAGPPGVGKTTLALKIASLVSTGGRWLDGSRIKKGPVLVIPTTEDDITRCTVPSILVQGGSDGVNVQSPYMTHTCEAFDPANPKHMESLAYKCSIVRPKLVIIDPIVQIVGGGDDYKEGEVRKALSPLQRLADECDAAVIGIKHWVKDQTARGSGTLDKVSGSGAWGQVARCVLTANSLGNNKGVFALARTKSNYGPINDGALVYGVESTDTKPDGKKLANRATGRKVVFKEFILGSADSLFVCPQADRESPKADAATDFLSELVREGMPVTWDQIVTEAKGDGITTSALKRARDSMKEADRIKCTLIGNPSTGKKYYWHDSTMDKDAVRRALKRH